MAEEKNTGQKEEKVVHSYHDYANVTEEETKRSASEDQLSKEKHPHCKSVVEHNFPLKLHYMLSELENDGMDSIVSWQPHGRCFLVHKHTQFVEQVLPQ
jgi:hypothetical protein